MAKREVEVPVTEGSGNVSANLGLVDQPKVSALMKGRLANFSSERLMRLLDALG
jgi:predicted XRE-type DNA-binding protein